jgi:hypothetical protein
VPTPSWRSGHVTSTFEELETLVQRAQEAAAILFGVKVSIVVTNAHTPLGEAGSPTGIYRSVVSKVPPPA